MYRRPLRWRRDLRGSGLLLSVLLALALLAAFLVWTDRQMHPVLETMAAANVSNAVTSAINNAIAEGIAERQISYDDMVTIEADESGRAAVLKSNMTQANLLRTQLLETVLERVSALSEEDFSIPLGNLTGLDFLSGWGPGVKVRVLSVGEVAAAFHNKFQDAGVNQTLHQVMLEITVTVQILLPGEMIETIVSTPVCVAETVIVGQVPETYLQLERGT